MTLKREISLIGGVSIALSLVIGTGLFALPALAIDLAGPVISFLAWLFLIFTMPVLVFILAHLGRDYPKSEGLILYTTMALGKWSKGGVLFMTLSFYFIGMPVFYLISGSFLADFFDKPELAFELAILISFLAFLANLRGAYFMSVFNSILVFVILGLLAVIVFISLTLINWPLAMINLNEYSFDGGDFWLACGLLFWAFLGFENMSFGFGEIKNPAIMIPKIYLVSYLLVSMIYVVFAGVLSLVNLSGIPSGGITGLSLLLGQTDYKHILLLAITLVLFANANSWTYSISRFLYSTALDGLLPKFITWQNTRKTPVISLLFCFLTNSAILLLIKYTKMDPKYGFQLTSQGFILLFGGSVITYFKLVTTKKKRLLALLAMALVLYLLQGFRWLLLYPLLFFVIGSLVYNRSVLIKFFKG